MLRRSRDETLDLLGIVGAHDLTQQSEIPIVRRRSIHPEHERAVDFVDPCGVDLRNREIRVAPEDLENVVVPADERASPPHENRSESAKKFGHFAQDPWMRDQATGCFTQSSRQRPFAASDALEGAPRTLMLVHPEREPTRGSRT